MNWYGDGQGLASAQERRLFGSYWFRGVVRANCQTRRRMIWRDYPGLCGIKWDGRLETASFSGSERGFQPSFRPSKT